MNRPVLALDLDDVLLNCHETFCQYHNATFGTSVRREDIRSVFFENTFGCTREESIERARDYYRSVYQAEAKPLPGVSEVLPLLRDGYDMHVVTARPEEFRAITETWLAKHFPGVFNGVHFTNYFLESRRRSKADVCKEIGATHFVDDSPIHTELVAEADIKVFLFDAPWNQETKHPAVTRVQSWDELKGHLLRL